MKLSFVTLTLDLKKQAVDIPLSGFRYFYGRIGSGKSSIGRIIDYCLGAKPQWTPALQHEFVSATVELRINDLELSLRRDRDAASVVATWVQGGQNLQALIPARRADGEVIAGSGVEVLSDLLFYLANEESPKVRRRQGRDDERLERLSFRDLYRFCYLDQQGMDSDFFRLNSENYAVKQKSVDAIRYVLGYHSEKVAELEARLQAEREQRLGLQIGARAMERALYEAGFPDGATLEQTITETEVELYLAQQSAREARANRPKLPEVDEALRQRSRDITLEVLATKQQLEDLDVRYEELERHTNELTMLSLRFQRTASARAVLSGVQFTQCPRCTQDLPQRPLELCRVCGQPDEVIVGTGALDERVVERDLKDRQSELDEAISRLKVQRRNLLLRSKSLESEKASADVQLEERLRVYDSEFLSRAIADERTIATLSQKLDNVNHNRKIPDLLQQQLERADALLDQETKIQQELVAARKLAFQDRRNIKALGELFLDCLVRSRFPDVLASDHVDIDPISFYPRIPLGGGEGLVVLTFDNAGSGGMMALFRTCFALALHRLSAKMQGSKLPPVLVIDTPTKNVSSVEDPEVINAFYTLVYELAAGELVSTQFIVIDNELTLPPPSIKLDMEIRHITRGDTENPPLVPYLADNFGQEMSQETEASPDEEDR